MLLQIIIINDDNGVCVCVCVCVCAQRGRRCRPGVLQAAPQEDVKQRFVSGDVPV